MQIINEKHGWLKIFTNESLYYKSFILCNKLLQTWWLMSHVRHGILHLYKILGTWWGCHLCSGELIWMVPLILILVLLIPYNLKCSLYQNMYYRNISAAIMITISKYSLKDTILACTPLGKAPCILVSILCGIYIFKHIKSEIVHLITTIGIRQQLYITRVTLLLTGILLH